MRFVAKVDDMGKTTELSLGGVDMRDVARSFAIQCKMGEMTVVTLELILVEVDLDLGNVNLENPDGS